MSDAEQIVAYRDEARRAELLRAIPKQWRRRVGAVHAGKLARRNSGDCIAYRYEAEREADGWLAETAAAVAGLRVQVDISDGELCDMAERCAHKAMTLGEFAPGFHVAEVGALRRRLNAYVEGFGIIPPGEKIEDAPALARMTEPLWWRRALRRAQGRQLEGAAIALGYVHKRAEIYASNATVERRAQQRRRNALNLENTEAVNLETGEVCNLAKLAESTVANPRIRRGELMTRISGFELVARDLGHVAEFITLTCPSVFHARRTAAGGGSEPNPRHEKANTPRVAAQYLGKVWARIRAKLARVKAGIYGFRIAEPHNDGCPHWHMVLFMPVRFVRFVRDVVRGYSLGFIKPRIKWSKKTGRYVQAGTGICWLDQHGGEPGAIKRRAEFVAINPGQGSAAGYVAKYVSKNIDGGGVDVRVDLAGDATYEPSQRVEAWASTWGVRQFQQIGGPHVGVWRELRRLPKGGDYSEAVERARAAADCGPISREEGKEQKTAEFWARYVACQGGPVVARKDLPVVLAKTADGERLHFVDGEPLPCPAPSTRYGEIAPGVVVGVRDAVRGESFFSMRGRWGIRKGAGNAMADRGFSGNGGGEVWSAGIHSEGGFCGDSMAVQQVELARAGIRVPAVRGGSEVLGGGFGLSRTRGNNCMWAEMRKDPADDSLDLAYFTFPPNSLVVLDEAQRVYRVRNSGTKVPPHVAAFETHRHQGIDFILITQSPKLIDANIRELVGKHIAIGERLLGRYLFEWPYVGDIDSKMSREEAVKRRFKPPKKSFGAYKSAEVHTKTPRRVHQVFFFLAAALAFFGYQAWSAYNVVQRNTTPTASKPAEQPRLGAVAQPATPTPYRPSALDPIAFLPTHPDQPASGEAYAGMVQVLAAPRIAACVSNARKCVCYSQQHTPLDITDKKCRSIAGGQEFNPYRPDDLPGHDIASTPPPAVQPPAPTLPAPLV